MAAGDGRPARKRQTMIAPCRPAIIRTRRAATTSFFALRAKGSGAGAAGPSDPVRGNKPAPGPAFGTQGRTSTHSSTAIARRPGGSVLVLPRIPVRAIGAFRPLRYLSAVPAAAINTTNMPSATRIQPSFLAHTGDATHLATGQVSAFASFMASPFPAPPAGCLVGRIIRSLLPHHKVYHAPCRDLPQSGLSLNFVSGDSLTMTYGKAG